VDAFTGDVLGVGFSLTERSAAYKAAKLCAAVDKDWYCGLFGYQLPLGAWDVKGVWTGVIYDRGSSPMSEALQESDLLQDGDSQEFVKTGRGKSKPTVEAKHRKSVHGDDGTPIRRIANRTIHEICRHELSFTVKQRAMGLDSIVADPEWLSNGVVLNPRGIRDFCDSKARTVLRKMNRDAAIRAFAERVQLKVTEAWVEYEGDRYNSPELPETGLLSDLKGGSRTVTGYALEMVVSTIWLEVPGDKPNTTSLVDLKIVPPRPDSDEELEGWTKADRDHRDALLSRARAELREEEAAARFEHESYSRTQEQHAARERRKKKADPDSAAAEAQMRGGGRPVRKAA
jgi:hypothetical protein